MALLEEYLGRTVDLLGFHGTGRPSSPLVQGLVGADGEAALIAGVLKLTQRFLVLLLTPTGSVRYAEDRGSPFLVDAAAGIWRTGADVEASFHAALPIVDRQLRDEETVDDPDDERFAGAEVVSATWVAGGAVLTLRIDSRAGTSREVLLPLDISILQ